jgi:hypothetical protein
MDMRAHRAVRWPVLVVLLLASSLFAPAAVAAQDPDPRHAVTDGAEDREEVIREDPSAGLQALDDARSSESVISDGPFARITKNLQLRGRGERLVANATTDVWAHGNFAYTGTFNSPCGGEPEAGVWIWDVRNKNSPSFVGVIESPVGSRSNDVKVADMNSGDILVHSNEACAAGGPGGIEVYNVDDPHNPVHQASIRLDEINEIVPFFFLPGTLEDVGSHNAFLFTQGERDYVSLVYNGIFHTFRTFDITDPTEPVMVNAWGAEELFDPGVGDTTLETDPTGLRTLNAVLWLLDGFGTSRNRLLHDITVNDEGTLAYLSNWDAGLVLLDISDISDPQVVSVALEPEEGSLDGEVNSHAAWPSEDGTIVVETEEDFDHVRIAVSVTDGPLAGEVFGGFEDAVGPPPPRLAEVGVIEEEAVWVGRGCDTDNFGLAGDQPGIFDPYENDPDGKIAVIRRGACTFGSKLLRAQDAGAVAVIIANNLPDQPGLASGSFSGVGDIPGLFVSTAAGDLFEANPTGNTVVLDPDEVTFDPWGGVRVWDYSDPENPVLASTFNTVCSASTDPLTDGCDPFGTYSIHNVIVESTDDGQVKAYISWYWDGMLVLDVTDPYNPEEVARFFDNSPEFIEANGGNPHDFWGVYKIPDEPWIFGSDRNGGLYTFIEQGAGSGRR